MGRQRWGRRIEFFLTTVGYSVGVGDLWRFPYLVMKNGGGAFLIPIVVFNLIGAIPIVYLEMIIGQYSQTGAVSVWSVCPIMKGVGMGSVIATFLFSIYYAVIIGWMLFYFCNSFYNPLPWASCDNDWNIKETCVITKEILEKAAQTTVNSTLANVSTTAATIANTTTAKPEVELMNSAEQFWQFRTLDATDGLHDLGSINWYLFGCLAAIEVFCFFCIFKGVKLSGKIVYFTVLGPFVLLAVFLVRGAILPGADIGIKFYLEPDLSKLTDTSIWAEACMQVFVSIGPGFGAMVTFASYNKFTNNCIRDAVLVCLLDLLTGFIGGFVIFCVLGHVSYKTGIDISEFSRSGLGLGFIAYPEAANYLPPPQLWCALFFFMSVFLGVDSQFPNYEVVVTAIRDEFPRLFGKKHTLLTLALIVVAFLLAIPMVTEGGGYLLILTDWFAATFSVTIFALIECLILTYVYGMKNLNANMNDMLGRGVPIIFQICWYFCTPVLLAVTVGFTIYTYSPPAFLGYTYPGWAVALGWMITAASLAPVPIYFFYYLFKTPGSFTERIKTGFSPSDKWGPPAETAELPPGVLPRPCDRYVTDDVKETNTYGNDNIGFNTKL